MVWREILDKVPAEKRWEIATKMLTGVVVGYDMILLDMVGKEKLLEMASGLWSRGGNMFIPMVKEALKIPVEDAATAGDLLLVAAMLGMGPEFEPQIIERTPKRAVLRTSKCPWYERHKELDVAGKLDCSGPDSAWCNGGLKAINPKLTVTLTKALPSGDPYCEHIVELTE